MTIERLDAVASTMDVARERALSGRVAFNVDGPEPFAGVLARSQTQGRGQRGRVWFAPAGECLLATYYYPYLVSEPRHAGCIALIAGLAVSDCIRNLCAGSEDRVGLKWPNDVLIGERKVAGILVEMVKPSGDNWIALVGVGVNVLIEVFPPDLAPIATSLRREGAADCNIGTLAECIGDSMHRWADKDRKSGITAILAEWRKIDRTPGRRYEAQTEGGRAYGTALGINDAGALRLALYDGSVLTVGAASSVQEV